MFYVLIWDDQVKVKTSQESWGILEEKVGGVWTKVWWGPRNTQLGLWGSWCATDWSQCDDLNQEKTSLKWVFYTNSTFQFLGSEQGVLWKWQWCLLVRTVVVVFMLIKISWPQNCICNLIQTAPYGWTLIETHISRCWNLYGCSFQVHHCLTQT